MAEAFIIFMVHYPFALLVLFPISAVAGYLYGNWSRVPMYATVNPGTGIVVDDIEQLQAEADSIVDNAVVQVLPPATEAINIVPIARTTLDRWNREQGVTDES